MSSQRPRRQATGRAGPRPRSLRLGPPCVPVGNWPELRLRPRAGAGVARVRLGLASPAPRAGGLLVCTLACSHGLWAACPGCRSASVAGPAAASETRRRRRSGWPALRFGPCTSPSQTRGAPGAARGQSHWQLRSQPSRRGTQNSAVIQPGCSLRRGVGGDQASSKLTLCSHSEHHRTLGDDAQFIESDVRAW
jgi:hypothetical protein